MKERLPLIPLIFLALATSAACDGKKCQEPKPDKEIEEGVAERVDEWMDTMDAYDLQREKVGEVLEELKPVRRPLTVKRRATRDAVISELMKPEPRLKVILAEVKAAKTYSMPYTWKVFDHTMASHRLFTTEQRVKLAEVLEKPPEPFSLGFIARRGIDLFLVSVSASDEQKDVFGREVDALERDTNALLKEQHGFRVELTKEWRARTPDVPGARKTVTKAADSIEAFAEVQVARAVKVLGTFGPAQREPTNMRLQGAMTCRDGQSP